MCPQVLVCVDISVANSSAVAAEGKKRSHFRDCVRPIYSCYSMNIWTLYFWKPWVPFQTLLLNEDLFSICSCGVLLVRPNRGNSLKCENIDRLHLLFLWDLLGSIFSAPCIHGEKRLQHKHDCEIALLFTQELAGHKGERKGGRNGICSALPTQAVREAGIEFINTNEKYWV